MTNAALPLQDYGYAYVNANGTVNFKSPNVSVTANGSGVYTIGLANPVASISIPLVQGSASGSAGIDFTSSVDTAPVGITTNDQIKVTTRVGGTPTNEQFFLIIRTMGTNAFEVAP